MPLRLTSSIGRKLVMAITGLALLGFVAGHLLGNLLVFAGPDALNAYAYKIKSMPGVLWAARLVLVGMLLAHVVTAFRLAISNAQARSGAYQVAHVNKAPLPSLVMLGSGLLVLAFIGFHLAHFTLGQIGGEHFHYQTAEGHHDVYAMVVCSFADPRFGLAYTSVYVLAMVCLAFHLGHALTSVVQTFGFEHPRLRELTLAVTLALAGGYIAIPLAVRLGCLYVPEVNQ